jgi:hypothetical protein
MAETTIRITADVTVTVPDEGAVEPIDLVKDGLKERTIPVPSYAPCGYSISRMAVKGLVEREQNLNSRLA